MYDVPVIAPLLETHKVDSPSVGVSLQPQQDDKWSNKTEDGMRLLVSRCQSRVEDASLFVPVSRSLPLSHHLSLFLSRVPRVFPKL